MASLLAVSVSSRSTTGPVKGVARKLGIDIGSIAGPFRTFIGGPWA